MVAAGFDVDGDVGAGEFGFEPVLDLVADGVAFGDGEAAADEGVEVEVPVDAAFPGLELVDLHDPGLEGVEDFPGAFDFLEGKPPIGELLDGAEDLAAGDREDVDGDAEGDRGIDPGRPGDGDRDEADEDARGGDRVGEEVEGVYLDRARLGRLAGAGVMAEDDEGDDERDRDARDRGAGVLDRDGVAEVVDRFDRDEDRGEDEEERFEEAREGLDFPVAVGMLAVGGFAGFADRVRGDEGGDEVEARVDAFGEDADGSRIGGDAEFQRREEKGGTEREARGARPEDGVILGNRITVDRGCLRRSSSPICSRSRRIRR